MKPEKKFLLVCLSIRCTLGTTYTMYNLDEIQFSKLFFINKRERELDQTKMSYTWRDTMGTWVNTRLLTRRLVVRTLAIASLYSFGLDD